MGVRRIKPPTRRAAIDVQDKSWNLGTSLISSLQQPTRGIANLWGEVGLYADSHSVAKWRLIGVLLDDIVLEPEIL